MGLDAVTEFLSCPVCHASMHRAGTTLRCDSGHCYDIAREGYVNLLSGGARPTTADSAHMVAARVRFLGAGHFDRLARAIADAVSTHVRADIPGPILDAGGGTGAYLAAALTALPDRAGMLLDISREACRVAARSQPTAGVVVSDTWGRLPLRDGAAAAVLDIFAPRNAPEFARVLHPGGALIVVTPTDEHLKEVVDLLDLLDVDPNKERRLADTLRDLFERLDTRVVRESLTLTPTDVHDVVAMGPSSAHISAHALAEKVGSLPGGFVATLSARLSIYRSRRIPII